MSSLPLLQGKEQDNYKALALQRMESLQLAILITDEHAIYGSLPCLYIERWNCILSPFPLSQRTTPTEAPSQGIKSIYSYAGTGLKRGVLQPE